jgi:hypothetical protein
MKYLVLYLLGSVIVCGLTVAVLSRHQPTRSSPEVSVWTDADTGCQYLLTRQGSLERRMVDNGVIYIHMGCRPTVKLPQVSMK